MKFNFNTFELRLTYVVALILGLYVFSTAGTGAAIGAVLVTIYIGLLHECFGTRRIFACLPGEVSESALSVFGRALRFALRGWNLVLYTLLACAYVFGFFYAALLGAAFVWSCVLGFAWMVRYLTGKPSDRCPEW